MEEMVKDRVRLRIVPLRKFYLILTVRGIDFVEEWYKSNEHIPPSLTKLYQLLLRTATLEGIINVWIATKLGFSADVINRAVSNRYLVLSSTPKKPDKIVLKRIKNMFSRPRREIYIF